MSVTASIVVDFSAIGGADSLRAELDNERNNGKTSFQPGDQVYFRVYKGEGISSYTVKKTAGGVSKIESDETETVKETLQFINESIASVSKPVKTPPAISVDWYGTDLGTLSKAGDSAVKASGGGDGKIGICEAEYTTEYDVWLLTPPSGMPSEYAILIVIVGE